MKCPHCDYKDGWDSDSLARIEGEHAAFWELPVKLEREERYYQTQRAVLCACPSCKKTFID